MLEDGTMRTVKDTRRDFIAAAFATDFEEQAT